MSPRFQFPSLKRDACALARSSGAAAKDPLGRGSFAAAPDDRADPSNSGNAVAQREGTEEDRTMGGPLEGIRALDFGHAAVGPVAAAYLALLGADVIKVEPPHGDIVRRSAPPVGGMGHT